MALPAGSLQDYDRGSFVEAPSNPGTPARQVVITNTVPLEANVTVEGDSITSGTVDGTPTGTERTFVNNFKNQVLNAHDLVETHTWLDFGTKNERLASTVYTSATFPLVTVTATYNYTLVSGNYRFDSKVWTTTPGG